MYELSWANMLMLSASVASLQSGNEGETKTTNETGKMAQTGIEQQLDKAGF